MSINLEDAIATAEEINAHEMDNNLKMLNNLHQQAK